MSKKICFISIFSYPLFNQNCKITFGGSEIQIYNYAKKLAQNKNYDISVMVGDFGQKSIETYYKVNVIKSFKLNKNILNYLISPFKLFFNLLKLNPDIIICRSKGIENLIVLIYKIIFRKKLIYMGACDNDFNGVFFKGFFGYLFKILIKYSSFIVSQNNYQLKTYKKNFQKNNIISLNNSFFIEKKKNFKKNLFYGLVVLIE
jgi:hypothetical protein